MNKTYDAIIIGAGVIGAPIAYELSRMGYKTLSVDKLPRCRRRLDIRFLRHRTGSLFHRRRRGLCL
jgi:2-polyprenyl-6-methoxyphenol hydroxylase-like FAD-dependent oxidoreductase